MKAGVSPWVCTAVGAGVAVAAWFRPALGVALAAWVAAAIAWGAPRVRGTVGWREVILALVVPALLLVKDLIFPGPLGRAAADAGLAAGWSPRQPDVSAAVGGAAAAGVCVAALLILRAWSPGERTVVGWCRGVALAATGLAAVLLTAPISSGDYGDEYVLGVVGSRNAASGAFALSFFAALVWTRWALRARNTWQWAAGAVATGLCVAAVAGLGSRGGLLALLVGIVFGVARVADGKARWLAMATGSVVVAMLLLAPSTVARLAALKEEYRLELWAAGARAWWLEPLGGVGGGGFADAFGLFGGLNPTAGARALHPDSSWVLLGVEWGAIVTGAFASGLVWLGRGGVGTAHDSPARPLAEAAVVAWAVAAIGDISFHRLELLVLGVPFLAIARPANTDVPTGGTGFPARVLGFAGAVLAGVFIWTENSSPLKGPWDQERNHRSGFEALARNDWESASAHFRAVVAVDPANIDALRLYGGALMKQAPGQALEFWRRLFSVAGDRAHGFLTDALRTSGDADRTYWMRALEERPELWVVLADSDERGAQTSFDRWRLLEPKLQGRSPRGAALAALARWGAVGDLRRWLAAAPTPDDDEVAGGGNFLRSRGRDDLAWVWLTHHLPESSSGDRSEPDPGLRARVMAAPDDFVAATHLVRQTSDARERLRLLEAIVAQKGAPPTMRVQLAYLLKAAGRDGEAIDHLARAAELIANKRAN